jgi:nitrous oxidase accessory protein
MKKRAFKIFLVVIFNLALISAGFATEIIVDPAGEIKTITQALALAENGDRIVVAKGRYREGNIAIDKSVELIGIDFPVIDGENAHEVLTITADDVTIRGFAIENAAISFIEENAAIKAKKVRNCVIENNRLQNNFFGIYLEESANSRISGNEIRSIAKREANSGNGIHLWYSKEITIRDNKIEGHRDGIYFEFVESSKVSNNLSENNLRYGLHFMFSNYCTYTGNTFRHNGAGVAVMYTHHIEMAGNRFENNWGPASFGILLKEITDSKIHHNIFQENTLGLYTEGSNRLRITNNTFARNGWAVRVMANSMDNTFTGNNFLDNTFDVATNSRQNFNTFKGNYWSHYKGYDLDKDGTGDVPFRPVRLFSFIVAQQPATLVLLRSIFIDILDLAEQMVPVLTPETLIDSAPSMREIKN